VVGAHLAFRLAYYGEALPNTYYLKLGGILLTDRLLRGGEGIAYTGLHTLYAPLLLAAAAFVVEVRRPRVPLLFLASVFLAQCAYSLYVGGDAWETFRFANRYLATALPLLMVLAAVGLHGIAAAPRRAAPMLAAGCAIAGLLVLEDWLPTDRLGFSPGGGTHGGRLLLPLAAAAAVLMAARLRGWVPVALAAAVVAMATNGAPVLDWARAEAPDANTREWVRTGVLLREHTVPGVRVAMFAAGNSAYFSHREGVDLLGKTDRVVAHLPPRASSFRPGHNKRDYRYSIGELRPEVLSELWYPTSRDLCLVSRLGYVQIAPRFYVLRGARGVDTAALARGVPRARAVTPFPTPRGCRR
jgi:hypothetical protein